MPVTSTSSRRLLTPLTSGRPVSNRSSRSADSLNRTRCLTFADVRIDLLFYVCVADHRRALSPNGQNLRIARRAVNHAVPEATHLGVSAPTAWTPSALGRPTLSRRVSSMEPSNGNLQESQRVKPGPKATSSPGSQNGQVIWRALGPRAMELP